MTNEIDNCQDCGKLAKLSRGVCNDCMKTELEALEKVKSFLRKNRDSYLKETIEKTGVSEKKIKKFIEEGRLIAGKNIRLFTCYLCKSPIHVGKLCDTCKLRLRTELEALEKEEKTPTTPTYRNFSRRA